MLGQKALTVTLVCGESNRFLDCNNYVVAVGMTGRAYGRYDYSTDNGEEPQNTQPPAQSFFGDGATAKHHIFHKANLSFYSLMVMVSSGGDSTVEIDKTWQPSVGISVVVTSVAIGNTVGCGTNWGKLNEKLVSA
ncbi:MAG: hypothetical protein LBK60_07710 [Verrucomicrobiales bacterium]|nr:hypothetical protein [Verrucomicrobiales bacterium]